MSVIPILRVKKDVPWIWPLQCSTSVYTNVGNHGKCLIDKHFWLVIRFRGMVRDTTAGREWGVSGAVFPTVQETSCVSPVRYNSLDGAEFWGG
jgi:hypothetical protein